MKIIGFALCLENDEEDSFVLNKLYPVIEPSENDPNEYLRIVDESGEDYLYPETYFEVVKLKDSAEKKLIGYFQANAVEGFVKI